MNYNFEWDPAKARQNRKKHRVAFEEAATIFKDPRALSVYDDAHSAEEDRWVSLGFSSAGRLIAAHHTFEHVDDSTVRIRIFSARKATKHEAMQYQE